MELQNIVDILQKLEEEKKSRVKGLVLDDSGKIKVMGAFVVAEMISPTGRVFQKQMPCMQAGKDLHVVLPTNYNIIDRQSGKVTRLFK